MRARAHARAVRARSAAGASPHQSPPSQHTDVSGPSRRPPNGTCAPTGTSLDAQPPTPAAPSLPCSGHASVTGGGAGSAEAVAAAAAAAARARVRGLRMAVLCSTTVTVHTLGPW